MEHVGTHSHTHKQNQTHTHTPGRELLAAAMFLNEREFVCGEGLVLVNVAQCRHEWADDDLCVVIEKVDL